MLIIAEINVDISKKLLPYNFKVNFVDLDYFEISCHKLVYNVTLVQPLHRKQYNTSAEYEIKMDKDAAPITAIFYLAKTMNIHKFPLNYAILDQSLDCYNITKQMGILYLKIDSACRKLPPSSYVYVTIWETGKSNKDYTVFIKLQTYESGFNKTRNNTQACDSSCSSRTSQIECESSCGLGAKSGYCTWVNNSTCSPWKYTCPDNACDELENLVPSLCPQDCADFDKNVNTAGLEMNSSNLFTSTACNSTCKTIVFVTLFVIFAIIIAYVVVKIYCKNHQTSTWREVENPVYKVPSVRMSFLENQEVSSSLWKAEFDAGVSLPNMEEVFSSKYEIPRESLTLGDVLGEGAFGIVYQGELTSIGDPGLPKVVAVKKLKDYASLSELRDLLSEYMLLRDLDHPNVLKLIGACTLKGPLMVIVEYCEFGSLKSYLVQYKKNLGSIKSDKNTETMDDVSDKAQCYSFAWQVARGMQYLGEMKLVHRDLATRNILVTSEKLVKISDFGLSRDVYEEDTYLKKSQGRVPVKWLAPECLYENSYTGRSDIWSYGIVLWEIVTYGATPYPGIAPEKLFSLLQAGYRMDKPSNCSDELYSVMLKCWRDDPLQRPSFRELVTLFEGFLSQGVDYLDLSWSDASNNDSTDCIVEVTIEEEDEAMVYK